MCIFKSQLIDKGTNKVTKENVIFDTTSSRYDLAIKEVEERVKLGWSVKASFMLGGGYLRVDYVRADPNRYKDVGKSSNTLDTNESVSADSKSSGYGGLGSVGCEETPQETVEAVVAPVESVEVKETTAKPTRKTTATKKA
ncbi:MAG: hypothetical protein RR623_00255 [Bacilli bacterium]